MSAGFGGGLLLRYLRLRVLGDFLTDLMLKKVVVGGVDVSDYVLPFKLELSFGDATHQIRLEVAYSVRDVVTLDNNLRVEVWRGFTTATDEKVFDGYITTFEQKGITYLLTDIIYCLIDPRIRFD